jgi:hypothetical protein
LQAAAARIVGKPNIFAAAESGDLALVQDHLTVDASCVNAKNNEEGRLTKFPPSSPSLYYCNCSIYEAKLYVRKLILLLSFSQWTPLHFSAYKGHLEVSRLLAQCRADLEAKDK